MHLSGGEPLSRKLDVTIVGTGKMARAIGTRMLAGRHKVRVVGRNPERAALCADAIAHLGPGDTVSTRAFADPLDGDVVVMALYYPEVREIVSRRSSELDGRIVVDVSNPINESFDGLLVPADSSATRELAALAPGTRFVKAFNTTFAAVLASGEAGGQPLDVLIAGDHDDAKHVISALARDGGLNPIDAGPLDRARELEALGLLHISLQEPLGTAFRSAVTFTGAAPRATSQ